jgi:hypothetical protein
VESPAKSPGANRTITRFVGGFALASLAASCLPLLANAAGQPLVPGLARGDAFAVYGLLIAALPALVLPTGFAVQPGRALLPLAPLLLLSVVFAVLPLAVAAWISGVAWTGVSATVSASLGLGAVMLHLRRVFGERAAVACGALGAALCVAAPLLSVFLESLGKSIPQHVPLVAPGVLVLAAAKSHGFPSHLATASFAVVAWALLFVKRKSATATACVVAGCVFPLVAFGALPISGSVTATAPAGGIARVGVPIPVEWTNAGLRASFVCAANRGPSLAENEGSCPSPPRRGRPMRSFSRKEGTLRFLFRSRSPIPTAPFCSWRAAAAPKPSRSRAAPKPSTSIGLPRRASTRPTPTDS